MFSEVFAVDSIFIHETWSRRRESNPPKSAWEADAIPIGDACIFNCILLYHIYSKKKSGIACLIRKILATNILKAVART